MVASKTVVEKGSSKPGLMQRWINFLLAPADPSNLGVFRIAFGLLMVIDIPQERGLINIFENWEPDMCYFPLFDFMQPFSPEWMHVVYLVMFASAFGVMVGFMYRISCLSLLVSYWYIFLLDKGVWNNHSYLYGLICIMLLISDSNRYWSIDGFLNPDIRNAHIPKWNYAIFKFQIFLVYFYAGIKKIDRDWMGGYSMTGLSRSWVFDPFRLVLSDEYIDLYLVHISGLCYDLFVGFFLLFDKTRPLGIIFSLSFHCMNSQLFSIGMFSYTMMASLVLFCAPDWPKKVLSGMPSWARLATPSLDEPKHSAHCLYLDETTNTEKKKSHADEKSKKNYLDKKDDRSSKVTFYHKMMLVLITCYVGCQCVFPYSHFITKGYNGWTEGLYGYSWDMMVHSWSTQHVRIRVVDLATDQEIFIRPGAFIGGGRRRHSRWNSHPDMIKQYTTCLAEKIKERKDLNITKPAVYLDVWRSLNHRFQQRFLDPNIDIVSAPWSPLVQTPWVLPLLTDLSPWREKLSDIERKQLNTSLGNFTDIVFVADFPGLKLENYISEELNTSLTVLHGEVMVEVKDKNRTVVVNEEVTLPSNETHVVYTVSKTPACWMYVYLNTTLMNNDTLKQWILHPETHPSAQKKTEWKRKSVFVKTQEFVLQKYRIFAVGFWHSYYAIGHLAFGVEYPWDKEDAEDDGELPSREEPGSQDASTGSTS